MAKSAFTFPILALTSPFKTGKPVEQAQTLLHTNRWGADYFPDKIDGSFGPLTGAACVRAKYWLGYAKKDQTQTFGEYLYGHLVEEGQPGFRNLPLIYQARRSLRIKLSKQKTFRQKALALGKTFIGYREQPINETIFGAWYGLNGNPWCAMFVSYCLDHCGSKFKEAYVPTILAMAEQNNQCYCVGTPIAGDLVIYDWNNDGTYDHVEFFEEWVDQTAGTFKALGGNTLPPGGEGDQSNGGGVYENTRGTNQGYHVRFIRVKA